MGKVKGIKTAAAKKRTHKLEISATTLPAK